jgi:hypothetical protein
VGTVEAPVAAPPDARPFWLDEAPVFDHVVRVVTFIEQVDGSITGDGVMVEKPWRGPR